jgi:hypothetical protein
MGPMNRIFIPAVVLLLLAACDGPLPFMAGGELKGKTENAPVTWQLASDSAVAQLETRPGEPYSINLTYVQSDGHFYIYAGDTRTNWVKHIEQNPLVKIRVDGTLYSARAKRVENDEEFKRFAAIWVNLSVFQRDPLAFEEVWLYRLEPR